MGKQAGKQQSQQSSAKPARDGAASPPRLNSRVAAFDGLHRAAGTVNRAERLHIRHSICGKLDFRLTAAEIEAGAVRWDLGRLYYIRHDRSGHCTHRDAATGICGVYEKRPGVCRTYSCAKDGRIWTDFERMKLNVEWLEQNLTGTTAPQMLGAVLYQIEALRPEVAS